MSEESQDVKQAKNAGEAAAIWWASVLNGPKLDNGDPFTSVFAAALGSSPDHTEEGIVRFARLLAEQINTTFEEDSDFARKYGITLRVDYHPQGMLWDCAEAAGLRGGLTNWPWKTTMWVKSDEVSVSYGYGAEEEVIWTKS